MVTNDVNGSAMVNGLIWACWSYNIDQGFCGLIVIGLMLGNLWVWKGH